MTTWGFNSPKMSLRFGAYLDLNVKTGGFHTLQHSISIILDKMVFLDPLGQDSQIQNSASLVSPSVDKGSGLKTHTLTHKQPNEWSVWVLTQLRECVCGGKRMDGWRRLMSAGTGRIVRHLMNECKLATVELIPPPRQD